MKYFGTYWTPTNGAAILCEVDGGICYEAFRTEAEAHASLAAFRTLRPDGAPFAYHVAPIAPGVLVHDHDLNSTEVSE